MRRTHVRFIVAIAALGLSAASTAIAGSAQIQITPLPSGSSSAISPFIYGLGTYMGEDRKDDNVWSLRPAHYRFGGNMAERFNWKVNSWNAGADWYFSNHSSRFASLVDRFLAENVAHDIASSVTLPLLGWVAKDGQSASFPTALFPNQQDSRDGAGNGIDARGKPLMANPETANVRIDPRFVAEWVGHLKTRFGRHPHYYIIGNEPMLWHQQHRDVHPDPATYDEVLRLFIATAVAVRRADPEAIIAGPALWGWLAMQQSAFDEAGPWGHGEKLVDRRRHNDEPFLQWFLKRVVAEERRLNLSLIDVVDVHFYPANETVRSGTLESAKTRRLRLMATRALWDREYRDESWIDEKIYLIPRLKAMAAAVKPSLRIAIGEYKFYGESDQAGGVALAEALGRFGEFGLDCANYWTVPPAGSPASDAFKLFRNYDGKGGAFGSKRLAASGGTDDMAAFASTDVDERKMTVVLINKSLTESGAIRAQLPARFSGSKSRLFLRTEKSSQILETQVSVSSHADITLPPLSFALLELTLENVKRL